MVTTTGQFLQCDAFIFRNNIWWSTLSKALLISKSTQVVNFLSSIPLRNASVV